MNLTIIKKIRDFLKQISTFDSYYSMTFEQIKKEAAKYNIKIPDYILEQSDDNTKNDFKLDLINELIRKDMVKFSKYTFIVCLTTLFAAIIALIISLMSFFKT